ncbi:MAG: FAD-dependent oxidoreductase [Candidatus Sumerlaeota bacterium]
MNQTEFYKSRKWNAEWIWTSGDAQLENNYCLFRKEFTLDKIPQSVPAFISADTRYRLYVNGDCIGSGPPQSQPFFQYYDERDLSPYLVEGENCVALVVNHLGILANTRGGLLFEMTDGDGATLLTSGADWQALQSDAWYRGTQRMRMNQAYPFQEWFDMRRWPEGWTLPGFEDGKEWENAVVVAGRTSFRVPAAGPWSRLVPRDIPFMTYYPRQAESTRWREERETDPTFYQVPFRSLVPGTFDNLLLAGRMLDADMIAFSGVRVMVNTNQMGEAAGVAAATVVDSNRAVAELDVSQLRGKLADGGSIVI